MGNDIEVSAACLWVLDDGAMRMPENLVGSNLAVDVVQFVINLLLNEPAYRRRDIGR